MALILIGCGDEAAAPVDGGVPPQGARTIEALGPEIGVAPGERKPIRVRYREEDGSPVAGAEIAFAIFGDPRGSTLSADRAETRDDGVAEVELSAAPGPGEYEFRVRASIDVSSVEFFVAVSPKGFADLVVRLSYGGEQEGDVVGLLVTLYGTATCAPIDPRDPPEIGPDDRAEPVPSLDLEASFENLLTQRSYAVLASGLGGESGDVAGCTDLAPGQLRVGATAATVVVLADLPLDLAGTFTIASTFALGDLVEVGVAVGRVDDLGDCLLDPAQRLLDAVRDAADTGTAAAIDAARAEPDGSGCRAGELDADLADLLASADPVFVDVVRGAGDDAVALAETLAIASTLAIGDDLSAMHRLGAVSFALGDPYAPVALPVAEAPLRAAIDGESVTLAPHAFTLRAGTLLARAVSDVALGGADARTLATRLAGTAGCESIDVLVCAGAGLAEGCLGAACEDGAAAIDADLAAGFAALDGAGLDFVLDGGAAAADEDDDGAADRLEGGAWAATVGDAPLALAGAFEATEAAK